MIIGLILLALLLLAIILGFTQRTFDRIRIPVVAIIVVAIACMIGIFIPAITIGSRFSMTVGGFIVPVLFAIYLMITLGASREMIRSDLAVLASAAVVFGLLFIAPSDMMWSRLLSGLTIGLICGSIAFLVAQNRKGALAASILGLVIGHTVYYLVARYALGWNVALDLGVGFMFDAIIMAALWAMFLGEILSAIRERSYSKKQAASFEAGRDYLIEPQDEFDQFFGE